MAETGGLHGSQAFYNLLSEMRDTHSRKSHDYATDSDPYLNYKFAGSVASLFAHSPDDAGFAGRLAEKMVRLAVLGKGQKIPLNESVADTERDIAVIATLWMAMRRDKGVEFAEPGIPLEYIRKEAGYTPETEPMMKAPLTPFGEFGQQLFSKTITLIDLMSPQVKKEVMEYLSISLRSFAPDSK